MLKKKENNIILIIRINYPKDLFFSKKRPIFSMQYNTPGGIPQRSGVISSHLMGHAQSSAAVSSHGGRNAPVTVHVCNGPVLKTGPHFDFKLNTNMFARLKQFSTLSQTQIPPSLQTQNRRDASR